MNPRRLFLLLAFVLASLSITACFPVPLASELDTGPALRGHLVIVGGGLKDDNVEIYSRFVSLCSTGPIGIIPIASGDGLKAGEEVAARWRRFAGQRDVIVIPLTQHDASKADDQAIAQQIASCGGLWFTGGQQDRVTAVLRPQGRPTACLSACFAVLNRFGVIGGTSAGAAIMSDPMITGGRSASAKSNDPDNTDSHHVTTDAGLGFFPFGLTDQHFIQRGRQGRLIDALRDTHVARGFGISENCALVVHRDTALCDVIGGPAAVWVFDASDANAFAGDKSRVRASVLSDGDRVNARNGRVTPRTTLWDRRSRGGRDFRSTTMDVWDYSSSMALALSELLPTRVATSTFYDARTSVTFESDDRTQVLDGAPGTTPCFIDTVMTIQPAPKIKPIF